MNYVIRFFYWNKPCFCLDDKKMVVQSTIMSVLDYGDFLYSKFDAIYQCVLRFITADHRVLH